MPPSVDQRIATLAASQFGVVERGQLRELGLADATIARRIAAGRLHRVRRGVYAVGHPLVEYRGRWLAAVLSCGPNAVLSHVSAADLWGLRRSATAVIDVTIPGTSRRRGPGLRVHRAAGLGAAERTVHVGIPTTTVARTILDLAARLRDVRQVERLLDRAEELRLADVRELAAVAEAHPGHHGAGRLGRVLREHTAGTTLTRSDLEERVLALCRRHRLPRPRVNHLVAGLEVDFLFAEQRVVVEADGWAFHRGRAAFERDRERDAILAAAGYRVLRFSHRQVEASPAAVTGAIDAALSAPALRA